MDTLTEIPATALVLVSVITSPKDLEIARVLGWYRIPLRKAPKVVDVDYLAFYQTSGFDTNERGKIQYIAPVLGNELTTRSELLKNERNHPRANEEYYKIQIGPLIRLVRPIQAADWKRVSFVYTTGKTLLEAKILNDLVLNHEERSLLWHSLRERGNPFNAEDTEVSDNMELSDYDLAMILGYMNHNDVKNTLKSER